MKVVKENKEKNIITLEIEEDYSKVADAMNAVYKDVSKQAKIPGFRKGKVPRNIFEKHYGKAALIEKATTKVMNDIYPEIIKEKELKPIDYPTDVQIVSIEEDKPFVFSLSIPVQPEVKLGKYKGIKVTKVDDTVTDEEVTTELDNILDKYSEFVEVKDGEVKEDNMLQYAIKATCDGESLENWTKEDSGTKIGTNMIHEDFDKALLGMKLEETKSFSIEFDQDYRIEAVQGKKVDFEVTIKEIREKKLPELDAEFVKKISSFDNADDYKADLKEKMVKHREAEAKQKMREELIEQIIDKAEVEVPQIMIDKEIENMLRHFDYSLKNSGLNLENYVKFSGKTIEDIKKDYVEPATKKVKADLCIDSIEKQESIEVTDSDIDEEIKKMAENANIDVEEYKKNINSDYQFYIKSYLAYDKTVNFLMDNAKISK